MKLVYLRKYTTITKRMNRPETIKLMVTKFRQYLLDI